jgi:hypothetical protein
MSDIVIPDPDLTTAEGTRKSLHDIHAAARSLAARESDLRAQLGTLAADLRAANQAMAELKRDAVSYGDASDRELRQFIGTDGKIRTVGKFEDGETWMPGLLDAQEPINKWHGELLQAVDDRNIVRAIRGRSDPENRRKSSPKCDRKIARILASAPPDIKRAFGDISTSGAEWIPDVMLPMLEKTLVMERKIAKLFADMPMSAKNMLLPFQTTGLRPYLKQPIAGDDPSQYTSSTPVTAQRTIDAVGFAVRHQLDEEATEDVLLDVMPILRQDLVEALVDGEEDAIINGCTSTHDDTGLTGWDIRGRWGTSGLGGTADHRRAWIGLRARATDVANTADGSSVETTAGILTARGSLTSPHGVSGKPVLITSPEWYILKMLGLTEVLTMDKFGPFATVLTGQLANIVGMPIILSEFVDAQYNASGVYDNSTKTKTGFLIVNPSRFKIGRRRGTSIELDKDITRGLFNLVATSRQIFFTVDPAASVKNVRWNYNLTAS